MFRWLLASCLRTPRMRLEFDINGNWQGSGAPKNGAPGCPRSDLHRPHLLEPELGRGRGTAESSFGFWRGVESLEGPGCA